MSSCSIFITVFSDYPTNNYVYLSLRFPPFFHISFFLVIVEFVEVIEFSLDITILTKSSQDAKHY